MKKIFALLVILVGTLVLAAPAEARNDRSVVVAQPSARPVGDRVVLSGHVRGATRTVRIEQRRSGRWALVRRAPVRRGAYAVTVTAARGAQFRAGAAGHYSRAVTVVPAAAVVTAPVRTVVPAPATDACGTVLKKADGTTWSCTFDDEFSGTSLNRAVWVPQTAFATGTQAAHACYRDDPANVSVSGGSLNLSLRKVATPVTCSFGGLTGPTSYVGGGVMSYRTFSQQYGRFEARVKNTATRYPGLHEAFWLWPDDRVASSTVWPYAGEMDISETYSAYPTLSIPFLHYSADAVGTLLGTNTAWSCSAARGQWNTYALEWTATKVQVIVNGRTCLTNTSGDPAFVKPYIMALTQGMGATGNAYDGRAPLGTMSVDYVKVWK
ncbi:MAG: family 16 glycosylhydrolase [Marmoricola sp.]